MGKNIVIIGLIILLGLGIYGKYLSFRVETVTKVKIETRIDTLSIVDTIVIPEAQVVYRDHYLPVKLPSAIVNPVSGVRDSIDVILPYHRYQDTLYQDSSTFAYNIEVEGYLRAFNYDFQGYTKSIVKTVTNTKTKSRIVDLFAVSGFSDNPHLGVDLVAKKWKIGYRYEVPFNETGSKHYLDFGYRLVGF